MFEDFSFGTAYDEFSKLTQGYFGMRTAEAQADASGAGQAALNNSVEETQSVGKTPVTTDQYQAVGESLNTSAGGVTVGGMSFTTTQLAIGAVALYLLINR